MISYELSSIINNNNNKTISIHNYYKIYYNFNINKLKDLVLKKENYLYSYKIINNYKFLNIIIYYFESLNIYCILTYHNIDKQRLLFVNSYLELLLYLYKLDKDLNINSRYTKILNKFPHFFFEINYNMLNNYFNNFDIVWN